MGNGQKTVINPNQNSQSNQGNTVGQGNTMQTDIIRQAFRNVSVNGSLNKDKFNQGLAIMESVGFKRLRDTPLADRLFGAFDKGKTGIVSQNQLINGINEILRDKNNAIVYSFKAYDSDNDNRISRKEFMQFIEESWVAAFRILAQTIERSKSEGIKIRDIQLWCKSKIQNLNEQSSKLFSRYDKDNKGFIVFPEFKELVNTSDCNNITAALGEFNVVVLLNLVNKLTT